MWVGDGVLYVVQVQKAREWGCKVYAITGKEAMETGHREPVYVCAQVQAQGGLRKRVQGALFLGFPVIACSLRLFSQPSSNHMHSTPAPYPPDSCAGPPPCGISPTSFPGPSFCFPWLLGCLVSTAVITQGTKFQSYFRGMKITLKTAFPEGS